MVEVTIVALLSEHTSTGLAILVLLLLLLLLMSRRVSIMCRSLCGWRIDIALVVVGHGCRVRTAG
jgi:hypothetical protein